MSNVGRAGSPFPIGDSYSPSPGKHTDTVQVGENNLSDVAKRLGVDPKDLQEANPQISGQATLKAGQEINLPQGQRSEAAHHGPERDDSNKTTQPPSSPIGDPLAKGFYQSKLDGAAKQKEFSEKDLGQLSGAGGAGAGKVQSDEYYKIHMEKPVITGQHLEIKPAPDFAKVKVSYGPDSEIEPQKQEGGLGSAKEPSNKGYDLLKLKPW
jgi:hypothetical protein